MITKPRNINIERGEVGGKECVGVDLLPRLYEVSERLESRGIGHAPIARGKLYDFDDESIGRHVNEI